MVKQLPVLIVVLCLVSLTVGHAAYEADKPLAASVRREIVNVAKGRPSHLILTSTKTFDTTATATATFKETVTGKAGSTSTFNGMVRRAETGNKLVVRLKCISDPPKSLNTKGRQSIIGELTVTLAQGGMTDVVMIPNVIGDNDPDACDCLP